jgi:uncharacterized protein (TIGR02145 family)
MKILKLTLFIFLLFLVFATCKKDKGMPTVTDVDGNVYHTVKIGTQTWMVENLKTTHYKDNTPVTLITDNNLWKNAIAPGYCWYDNDIANKTLYGALYNGYAAHLNKIAPVGWHVPSKEEFQVLEDYLIASGYNFDHTKTGDKIAKSIASNFGWLNYSSVPGCPGYEQQENGKTGLKIPPGGWRSGGLGDFGEFSIVGYLWTSSTSQATSYFRSVVRENPSFFEQNTTEKNQGYSIRCIKD